MLSSADFFAMQLGSNSTHNLSGNKVKYRVYDAGEADCITGTDQLSTLK